MTRRMLDGRLADALEVRVAERTARLHAANDQVDAMRRVATLVAEGVTSAEIFSTVSDEVGRLFGSDISAIVRFERDGTAAVMGAHGGPHAPGARIQPEPGYVVASVRSVGRAARFDTDKPEAAGMPAIVRALGIRSALASPIVVEGELWGAITLASRGRSLSAATERQLADFTELVGSALANAQARDAVSLLAHEQAALRRMATLVAQGVSPAEIFAAVSDEVGRLFGSNTAAVVRFDYRDPALVFVSVSENAEDAFAIGTRWGVDEPVASAEVYRTGRSARTGPRQWSAVSESVAAAARRVGLVSTVASPIVVEGRRWGAIVVGSVDKLLPPDTEERLEGFTELLATAVANSDARGQLRRLLDEQSALRRVATLVARGAGGDELFAAVAQEIASVIGIAVVGVHQYEADGTFTMRGIAGETKFTAGSRYPIEDEGIAARILATGRPARKDNYSTLPGPLGAALRDDQLVSTVGVPIVVDDAIWGFIVGGGRLGVSIPPGIEERFARFTDLVATAISNNQAREDLHCLADQQTALRRVATLVAKEASPAELFAKVAEEAANAVGDVDCGLLRDERDGTATVVAAWGAAISAALPIGTRLPVDGDGVIAGVVREGRPRRVDDYSAAHSILAEDSRQRGFGSAVGSPIVVRGRVWGALIVVTSGDPPCPPESEQHIGQFADLVATAIANAEVRAEVSQLADEQAALRRVATLVAGGVDPAEVFAAVSDEVCRLVGAEQAAVGRFDVDAGGLVFVVGASDGYRGPIGAPVELADYLSSAEVYRTGRPARRDLRADQVIGSGSVVDALRSWGFFSAVSAPIVVEGSLWGVLNVLLGGERLPRDTEERLRKFAELVATAIANAESRSELSASRRRIVAASDEARRRIERDLHDGTQQRLVSLGLEVRLTEARLLPEQSDLRDGLSRIATGLGDAVTELREIARGIHPAILAQGGLGPALRTLARRSAIPVELQITTDARSPAPVEIAVYYVASEALANAAKHARASRIDVSLGRRDSTLLLEIHDDGAGGADPARGSGLVGLFDRVEALGGSIRIDSAAGAGTRISVELPVRLAASQS
jgi:GAF domain-containing protein